MSSMLPVNSMSYASQSFQLGKIFSGFSVSKKICILLFKGSIMETLQYNNINLQQTRVLVGKPREITDQITKARTTALHQSATMPSSEFFTLQNSSFRATKQLVQRSSLNKQLSSEQYYFDTGSHLLICVHPYLYNLIPLHGSAMRPERTTGIPSS